MSVVLVALRLIFEFSWGELGWDVGGLMLGYFTLRGVRWVWIFLVVTPIFFLLLQLLAWNELTSIAVGIVALALLLAPETRRYFRRSRLSLLKGNAALQAAVSAVGLLLVSAICRSIGGPAEYVGLSPFYAFPKRRGSGPALGDRHVPSNQGVKLLRLSRDDLRQSRSICPVEAPTGIEPV